MAGPPVVGTTAWSGVAQCVYRHSTRVRVQAVRIISEGRSDSAASAPLKRAPTADADDSDDTLLCRVCQSAAAKHDVFGEMLLCDWPLGGGLGTCDAGYHLKCLPTPLDAVPAGEFFCPMHRANVGTVDPAAVDSGQRVLDEKAKARREHTKKTSSVDRPVQAGASNSDGPVQRPAKVARSSRETSRPVGADRSDVVKQNTRAHAGANEHD